MEQILQIGGHQSIDEDQTLSHHHQRCLKVFLLKRELSFISTLLSPSHAPRPLPPSLGTPRRCDRRDQRMACRDPRPRGAGGSYMKKKTILSLVQNHFSIFPPRAFFTLCQKMIAGFRHSYIYECGLVGLMRVDTGRNARSYCFRWPSAYVVIGQTAPGHTMWSAPPTG